ncbi:MAG: hypothetical protein AAF989_01390 [Planctomycetota bacterium]
MAMACSGVHAESIVKNGDFSKWRDGIPSGWEVSVGAKNGADAPVSEVRLIAGPALMLRGDSETMAWRVVSQELPMKPGQNCRLKFQARTKGIRRQGRQFQNCYVALMSKDARGTIVGQSVVKIPPATPEWKTFESDYVVPEHAGSTSVYVFLSMSGILGVRDIQVEPSGIAQAAAVADSLLTNGELKEWVAGVPKAWQVTIGARNGGDHPASKLEMLDDGGARLSGNVSTIAWRSLAQDVRLRAGKTYTLQWDAVANGVRREGRQFNNCFVGIMHTNAGGKKIGMEVQDLSSVQAWKNQNLRTTVPAGTTKSTVMIFLSKTGNLQVRNVSLKEAAPQNPF